MKFKKEAKLKKMSVVELKKLHNEAEAERKKKYLKKKYTNYMKLINTIISKKQKKKLMNASKFVSKQNIFLEEREKCIQKKIKKEYTPKFLEYKEALEQIQAQIDRQMKNKETFCPKDEKKCKKAELLHKKHVKRRTDKQKENEELEALRERIRKEGCKSHYSKLKF